MDGWIILDKPSGVFSRTAGGRIARWMGAKTFGHIGTLDPMASGVLPIALGKATKTIPFLEDLPGANEKEYLFSIRFGCLTDTLDITGHQIACDNKIPTENDLKDVLARFVGNVVQIPPMFSAVHLNGHRAYEMARSGCEIEMPKRHVQIYDLEFIGIRGNDWDFRVRCSRGTYVRSLARDIADVMGCMGVASMIRRTVTGGYTIKNAVKLDFLENLVNNNADLSQYLNPIDFGLGDIPVENLDKESANLYRNGGFIKLGGHDGLRRVYNDNVFIGIGYVSDNVLHPKRTI